MTERTSRPKEAVEINSYEEFDQYIRAFATGHLNLVIVIGRAGVAKSQTVRQSLPEDVCWIEGNATAFGIYCALHRHRDQLVVIDDVDSLYSNPSAVRLLKCLCQTDESKTLAWHTASTAAAKAEDSAPSSFQTTSRLLIIANDWKTLNANTAAVQDRGHVIFFDPSAEAVHRKVAEWFWDQEVHDWFAEFLHLIPHLSMRHYVRASELRAAGIDWVKPILSDDIPEKALLVAKLKGDASFTEERQRVEAFKQMGGGGRTTWYKWTKRVASPSAASLKMPLPNARPTVDQKPKLRVVHGEAG